ncbi:hypothetical protein [Streptomyces paromomycinus]|uniref:Uncharacterized protein n=1 Tax=Streptomyces paromomycinus TaxID=92743 RepID=A0A401VZ15_STREY|nr:hypothetical protein [Streptomyces paromomycinus]GCD42324.1 hypothetical protein GKJPGBOP_01983 [Streptomyces paromomycinus]
MVAKRRDGIFPRIGTGVWGRNLADAIENTCAEHGVAPRPGRRSPRGWPLLFRTPRSGA